MHRVELEAVEKEPQIMHRSLRNLRALKAAGENSGWLTTVASWGGKLMEAGVNNWFMIGFGTWMTAVVAESYRWWI